jgi:ATP-dependent DNA helicase RecQ
VFCSSRPGTEKLSRYLKNELGGDIRFYHAGLSREEKNDVEQWFFGNPRGTLISTCAYGMGVDKADIRTVIHRDCPPSVEAYLQESGRAGRDGKPSGAILLWGPGDEARLKQTRSGAEQQRLASLLDYARDGQHCRREALLRLLNYEGLSDRPETGCCDVCDAAAGEYAPGLREEPPLIDFFRRNRRALTLKESIRVLSEAQNIRWSEEDAKQAVGELIRMKKLKISRNPLWKGKISPYSSSSPRSSSPASPAPSDSAPPDSAAGALDFLDRGLAGNMEEKLER